MDYLKILGLGYLILAGGILGYLKENNFKIQDFNPLEDMLEQVWNR